MIKSNQWFRFIYLSFFLSLQSLFSRYLFLPFLIFFSLSLQQHNSVLISHNHSQPSSSPYTTTTFNSDRRVLHHHHRHALHHHHRHALHHHHRLRLSLSFSLLSVESEFIYFGKGRWRRQRRLMEDEVAEAVARELSRLED